MTILLLLPLPLDLSVQNNKPNFIKFHLFSRTPKKVPFFQFSCYSSSSASISSTKTKFSHFPISSSQAAKPHKTPYNQTAYLQLKSSLFDKLKEKGSNPLEILDDYGDWSEEMFWGVVRFLKQASRSKEILQVFYSWKDKENSRINEFNYEKIIWILVEEGLVEEAVLALGDVKNHEVNPTLEIYYSLIHGLTGKGRFEDALIYLKELGEKDLKPESDMFDSFIKAYGKYKMYDEMGECVKQMESFGCLPDYNTYNLLIREFSQAGLLKQMERTYQIIVSKRMDLQPSTSISMLEAYANFGMIDKMEKFLKKGLKSRFPLADDLIRKIAGVYINNHMFSRVEKLGVELSSKIGRTDLVWCLRMLSHACILSQKGMNSVVLEMEADGLPWNVTVANILLLTYLKMRNFTHLNIVLSELPARYVKPDIVTFGILFDAYRYGFNGTNLKNLWRKMGFFDESIEMKTDALVLASFGKGHFLKTIEEVYSSFDPDLVKGKIWTYRHLINLVRKTQAPDRLA